jgi:hypothetical protein
MLQRRPPPYRKQISPKESDMQVAHPGPRHAAEASVVTAVCGAQRPGIAYPCAQAVRYLALAEGE